MTGRNAVQKISVYNILGLTYDELGDLEKSSLAFESALSIDPKSAETLAHYSLMLSRRIAASEKAMDMTQKVINQGKQPPMIHEILAQVFYNQKNTRMLILLSSRFCRQIPTVIHITSPEIYRSNSEIQKRL